MVIRSIIPTFMGFHSSVFTGNNYDTCFPCFRLGQWSIWQKKGAYEKYWMYSSRCFK
jgi:hypothetical protein